MYDAATRSSALARLESGESLRAVSMWTGISRATLRSWVLAPEPRQRSTGCARCADELPQPIDAYCYLLGMYLGDGCISAAPRTTALRIVCADSWPAVMAECEVAMKSISQRPVYRTQKSGCTELSTLWKHWPCLFPQHGPGRKHERLIVLAPWQQSLVDANPKPLIRGLLHSDGCRSVNTVRHRLAAGPSTYSYPRYFFTNESPDIRGVLTKAFDTVGVAWRQNRRNSISVARREAVAALDEFVGPKA